MKRSALKKRYHDHTSAVSESGEAGWVILGRESESYIRAWSIQRGCFDLEFGVGCVEVASCETEIVNEGLIPRPGFCL